DRHRARPATTQDHLHRHPRAVGGDAPSVRRSPGRAARRAGPHPPDADRRPGAGRQRHLRGPRPVRPRPAPRRVPERDPRRRGGRGGRRQARLPGLGGAAVARAGGDPAPGGGVDPGSQIPPLVLADPGGGQEPGGGDRRSRGRRRPDRRVRPPGRGERRLLAPDGRPRSGRAQPLRAAPVRRLGGAGTVQLPARALGRDEFRRPRGRQHGGLQTGQRDPALRLRAGPLLPGRRRPGWGVQLRHRFRGRDRRRPDPPPGRRRRNLHRLQRGRDGPLQRVQHGVPETVHHRDGRQEPGHRHPPRRPRQGGRGRRPLRLRLFRPEMLRLLPRLRRAPGLRRFCRPPDRAREGDHGRRPDRPRHLHGAGDRRQGGRALRGRGGVGQGRHRPRRRRTTFRRRLRPGHLRRPDGGRRPAGGPRTVQARAVPAVRRRGAGGGLGRGPDPRQRHRVRPDRRHLHRRPERDRALLRRHRGRRRLRQPQGRRDDRRLARLPILLRLEGQRQHRQGRPRPLLRAAVPARAKQDGGGGRRTRRFGGGGRGI
ncbi:MAG: Delta-1-pyrroline-5-carboxylate dehydrogenase, partial [uncultured Thermomicrobiales bacterium]